MIVVISLERLFLAIWEESPFFPPLGYVHFRASGYATSEVEWVACAGGITSSEATQKRNDMGSTF